MNPREFDQHESMLKKISALETENKRLRDALQFYADGSHCYVSEDEDGYLHNVVTDEGDVAKRALEQRENKR